MNQTDQHQGNGNGKQSLGAQAAAAASQHAKEPESAGAAGADAADADEDDETKGAKRVPKKVFIVIGDVHEFKNNREAEKFLNEGGAPNDFRVIKGSELVRRQRVALG